MMARRVLVWSSPLRSLREMTLPAVTFPAVVLPAVILTTVIPATATSVRYYPPLSGSTCLDDKLVLLWSYPP